MTSTLWFLAGLLVGIGVGIAFDALYLSKPVYKGKPVLEEEDAMKQRERMR